MELEATQPDEGDPLAGDFLTGAAAIGGYLTDLGMTNPDVYYLKRIGWPIGNAAGDRSTLIASKRRLARHIDKRARGNSVA